MKRNRDEHDVVVVPDTVASPRFDSHILTEEGDGICTVVAQDGTIGRPRTSAHARIPAFSANVADAAAAHARVVNGGASSSSLLPPGHHHHVDVAARHDNSSLASSPTAFSSPSSSERGSEDDDDDDDDDVQTRLLQYARMTAQAAKPSAHDHSADSHHTQTSLSSQPTLPNSSSARLSATLTQHTTLSSSTASSSSSSAASGSGSHKLHTTLQRLRTELTRPVAASTALTVVDAADETADTVARILSAKLPTPPTATEAHKLRRLQTIIHAEMHYRPIRKDFYVVPPDMRHMSTEELRALMKELDGAKIFGAGTRPPPLRLWHATGLSNPVLATLERLRYTAPFAIQSVGIPVLMSGRDLLITAKTGSGKTLCYVLPMLRHCGDQPRCGKGEGPIGLVLVPTQELASQIMSLLQTLCAAAELRCVASFGSTSLADNIRQVKAGCEVMVATPGRLLDLLTVHGTGVMSLQRVSFVVVDEVDRLFDSGFMEHVVAFLRNIRPDRQAVMVSATLPKMLKKTVLQHMQSPVEVSTGGRPCPASQVEQSFVFVEEAVYEVEASERVNDERLRHLVQLLGSLAPPAGEAVAGGGVSGGAEGEGRQLVLIFVQNKDEVEVLSGQLAVWGYQGRIATLYAGMHPIDREFALEHFAPGKQFILIATAVAERGLDLAHLDLVVNYSLPDHYEAYVHRIGRTGRAGKAGRAVSFFVRGRDDDIAPELVEGLELAGQRVPEELYERAARMRALRKEGAVPHNRGFYRGYLKGKPQRLSTRDEKAQLREAAKASGLADFLSDSDSDGRGGGRFGSESDSDSEAGEEEVVAVPVGLSDAARRARELGGKVEEGGGRLAREGLTSAQSLLSSSQAVTVYGEGGRQRQHGRGAASASVSGLGGKDALALTVASTRRDDRVAQALAYAQKTTEAQTTERPEEVRFQLDYVINDMPDVVRGRLQSAALLRRVSEETDVTIVKKGVYYDARYKHSHKLKEGDRPLYLLIVGRTSESVQAARAKLNEVKSDVLSRQRSKGSVLGAVL